MKYFYVELALTRYIPKNSRFSITFMRAETLYTCHLIVEAADLLHARSVAASWWRANDKQAEEAIWTFDNIQIDADEIREVSGHELMLHLEQGTVLTGKAGEQTLSDS